MMHQMILLISNNNTVHGTIKMKPNEVIDNYYAKNYEIPNKTNPKFKVGDHVRISKYNNIFAKGYAPNWSEEIFVINKNKNTVPWTYAISNLNGEEITGSFYEKKNAKKLTKKNLEQKKYLEEKVINYMSNGKDIIIHLIKKTLYKNE